MIRMDITDLVKALQTDSRSARLRKLFDTSPLYSLPLEKLSEEIAILHKTRPIRRLNPVDARLVDSIVNANVFDQATRSRLTEILMTCLKSQSSLEAALESLRHHLLLMYQEDFKQFRTKEERMTVLDMALRPYLRYLRTVSTLRHTTELVISDIDKGAWSLRALTDALKIHSAREVHV